MKYDYLNNKLVDGSTGAKALGTRIFRVGVLLRHNRISDDEASAYILRDFPFAWRIRAALDAEVFPRGVPIYGWQP